MNRRRRTQLPIRNIAGEVNARAAAQKTALGAARKAIRPPSTGRRTKVDTTSAMEAQMEAQLGGHAGIGKQLQRRVAAGEITLDQAQKTARERQTFKKAYGSDWRQDVYGMDVGGLRSGLAGEQADDPQYQAAYNVALERRKKMLEQARAKVGGMGGVIAQTAPQSGRSRTGRSVPRGGRRLLRGAR